MTVLVCTSDSNQNHFFLSPIELSSWNPWQITHKMGNKTVRGCSFIILTGDRLNRKLLQVSLDIFECFFHGLDLFAIFCLWWAIQKDFWLIACWQGCVISFSCWFINFRCHWHEPMNNWKISGVKFIPKISASGMRGSHLPDLQLLPALKGKHHAPEFWAGIQWNRKW